MAAALGGMVGIAALVFLLVLIVCWLILPFIIMSKLGRIEHQLKLANQQTMSGLKELRAIHKYYAVANPTVEPAWPYPEDRQQIGSILPNP